MTYRDAAEREVGKVRCSIVTLRAMAQHALQAGDRNAGEHWHAQASELERALNGQEAR